jgi:hypothetical protein
MSTSCFLPPLLICGTRKLTLHQQGGFTGIVPSSYRHLDFSHSRLGDEEMLILSTSMYPNFTKVPTLVRVNRLLQVP